MVCRLDATDSVQAEEEKMKKKEKKKLCRNSIQLQSLTIGLVSSCSSSRNKRGFFVSVGVKNFDFLGILAR